jgi:small-conductance mechanosensitive channel
LFTAHIGNIALLCAGLDSFANRLVINLRMRISLKYICVLFLLTASAGFASAQASGANSTQPNSPLAANSASIAQDPAQVIQFLSRTISWHREVEAEGKLANRPTDLSFAQANAHIADQVVRLAFEYARGQAQIQAKQAPPPPASSDDNSQRFQRLAQAADRVEQQLQQTQTEAQQLRQKLAQAPERKRAALEAQLAEVQSEVNLLDARHEALENMTAFVTSKNNGGSVGLRAQIEELAQSVPAQLSRPSSAQDQTGAQSSGTVIGGGQQGGSGIWELSGDIIRLSGKIHTLNDEIEASEALAADADKLHDPLVDNMRQLIKQGDQISTAADTSAPDALAQQKQQLDRLAAQFRQTSAQLLPLSKIRLLLGMYQTTLKNWKESVRDDMHDRLRQLLLKLGVLAVLICVVILLGELWRRATFRYVHDGRRRYQFLLLRRVAIWIAIAIIIILAFASQLGSAVTFAGLLTAGIAVALQNVIVSIVGYFFLIGKYGLRVGDRVQIAGVTGEVVEIGLVRIHLMELGGPGENQPTGRVVAFSNSIVFQSTAGVFKQIPGTNFVWRELKLTLASDTDYHAARERITKAIDSVLSKHKGDMDDQRKRMEMNLSPVSSADLGSRVHLRYVSGGIEASVRYPVEIGKAADTDDQLMRELLEEAAREPKFRIVSTEMPLAKVGV